MVFTCLFLVLMMSNMHKVHNIEIKIIPDGSTLQLTAGITWIGDSSHEDLLYFD